MTKMSRWCTEGADDGKVEKGSADLWRRFGLICTLLSTPPATSSNVPVNHGSCRLVCLVSSFPTLNPASTNLTVRLRARREPITRAPGTDVPFMFVLQTVDSSVVHWIFSNPGPQPFVLLFAGLHRPRPSETPERELPDERPPYPVFVWPWTLVRPIPVRTSVEEEDINRWMSGMFFFAIPPPFPPTQSNLPTPNPISSIPLRLTPTMNNQQNVDFNQGAAKPIKFVNNRYASPSVLPRHSSHLHEQRSPAGAGERPHEYVSFSIPPCTSRLIEEYN